MLEWLCAPACPSWAVPGCVLSLAVKSLPPQGLVLQKTRVPAHPLHRPLQQLLGHSRLYLWALVGARSARASMSLSPLAGIAPASFICCLHDWQGLLQRGRGRGHALSCRVKSVVPSGIVPATAQPCKVRPSAAQSTCMVGLAVGTKLCSHACKDTGPVLHTLEPYRAPGGGFGNNESSGPAKTPHQDWQHQVVSGRCHLSSGLLVVAF